MNPIGREENTKANLSQVCSSIEFDKQPICGGLCHPSFTILYLYGPFHLCASDRTQIEKQTLLFWNNGMEWITKQDEMKGVGRNIQRKHVFVFCTKRNMMDKNLLQNITPVNRQQTRHWTLPVFLEPFASYCRHPSRVSVFQDPFFETEHFCKARRRNRPIKWLPGDTIEIRETFSGNSIENTSAIGLGTTPMQICLTFYFLGSSYSFYYKHKGPL